MGEEATKSVRDFVLPSRDDRPTRAKSYANSLPQGRDGEVQEHLGRRLPVLYRPAQIADVIGCSE